MKKTIFEIGILILGIVLAYWSLESVGNNEKYFTGLDSPTYVFGLALVAIFQSSHFILKQLAQKLLRPSSIWHTDVSEVLKLKDGQKPYLEAISFCCGGALLAFSVASYIPKADTLHNNQYSFLSFLFLAGILCVGWGLLKAFLTFLRLPEND